VTGFVGELAITEEAGELFDEPRPVALGAHRGACDTIRRQSQGLTLLRCPGRVFGPGLLSRDAERAARLAHKASIKTSRSFEPLAGPTRPRRSIVSTSLAARL